MTTIQAGEPGPVAGGRFRLASPATATALGILTLVLMAAALALSGLTRQLSVLGSGPIIPIVVIYAGVGVIVARRQPRNPIGWILIGFIAIFLLSSAAGSYAVLYYRFGHHGLPLAQAAVLLEPSWAPALVLFPVAILLFPDGRLTSRRWRVLQVYVLAGVVASAAVFSPAVTAVARRDVRLDSFGDVVSSRKSPGGLLATQVMEVKSPVAVAASTLAAAALFNPLRRRVQHAVDRRFNRARYDADEAVAAFAGRLKDAVDLDSVRDDLTGIVQQTLVPAHLSVWVRPRD